MKMINWAELTDLASPEMLIFASFEPQELKNRSKGYLLHNFPDIFFLVFGNWFQN